VVVRRSCLNETGMFDEQFKGVEDYDLWLRLSYICQFAYLERPLVCYRQQQGSLSTQSAAMRKGELAVVEKAISHLQTYGNTECQKGLGNRQLKARLQALHWDIGYDAYAKGNYSIAREHLSELLTLRPFHFHAALLWFTTWFPGRCISALRNWKNRYTARNAVAATL